MCHKDIQSTVAADVIHTNEAVSETANKSNQQEATNVLLVTVNNKLQNALAAKDIEDVFDFCKMHRFVISIEKQQELKGLSCKELCENKVCGLPLSFSRTYGRGTLLELHWYCSNNHFGQWVSYEVLTSRSNNDVYVNDILVSSSILLTGNYYTKFSLLCKTLNLYIPEISCYSDTQKLYTTTVILQF